jgi:hypothetical protein
VRSAVVSEGFANAKRASRLTRQAPARRLILSVMFKLTKFKRLVSKPSPRLRAALSLRP